jgi:hypothetical protein
LKVRKPKKDTVFQPSTFTFQLREAPGASRQFCLDQFAGGAEVDEAGLGALLEGADDLAHFLLRGGAGGTEIEAGGDPVLVITPQSPLGRQLMGRKQGDTLQLDLGGKRSEFRVSSVA